MLSPRSGRNVAHPSLTRKCTKFGLFLYWRLFDSNSTSHAKRTQEVTNRISARDAAFVPSAYP
jgi:hypothetical protein